MDRQLCAECGAPLTGTQTCQDDFHQLLFWENQYPELGSVHHLLVTCYHLQHPAFYSPEGLAYALELLTAFVEQGLSPQDALQRSRGQVRSDRRDWKVTARPGRQASYAHPVEWTTRAADIVAAGPGAYIDRVRAWARSILADLRASGNLPR